MNRRYFLQAMAGVLAAGPARGATAHELVIAENARGVTINGPYPGPLLRWREGDDVEIAVVNRLNAPTSIHWHGLRVPSAMDGVPGLSFHGIPPSETFIYRFPLQQAGTYWYHGHSGFQEQRGLIGPIIIDPRDGEADRFDRDHVLVLSDWTDKAPRALLSDLKFQSDVYNRSRRTLTDFIADIRNDGLASTISDRMEWGRMGMSPTDIADIGAAAYRYLVNGRSAEENWTALFAPGESVRLRVINAAAMSFFDLRIPGLKLTIIQADGNAVEPVAIDEFRIGPAETYDLIVTPEDRAYTIFAETSDRSGYARATLAPHMGMTADIPPRRPRPLRTVADMGMKDMGEMEMPPSPLEGRIGVDNVAMMPAMRVDEAGDGLGGDGRDCLTYARLKARRPGDPRPPTRDIELHLTGNMQRYVWGFDGLNESEAPQIALKLNERVRFRITNDTMMEHPLHLHGLWSELENGQDLFRPRKHTVIVKPGERLSFLVTADVPGLWAFHCHLLFHMETGMFRTVAVA